MFVSLAVRPLLCGRISVVCPTYVVPLDSILFLSFLFDCIYYKTQDIDIVVSEDPYTSLDAEDIKEQIADADSRYYLEHSRKRGATHQILYCRLPGWSTDAERCVKVDILVPPTLKLPIIIEEDIVVINNIPVMPLFDLLVMKTQGWWGHRNSPRDDFREKVDDDVSDIFALLKRARKENISYDDEADEERHTREFMSHARALANRFVNVYGMPQKWRVLDFPV